MAFTDSYQVFEFLKSHFGVNERCWTSARRIEYGDDFEPFAGSEAEHSDFTISDPNVSRALTRYLLDELNVENVAQWSERSVTYHIEVKTTVSHQSDTAFDMSNNQMDLVRESSFAVVRSKHC